MSSPKVNILRESGFHYGYTESFSGSCKERRFTWLTETLGRKAG